MLIVKLKSRILTYIYKLATSIYSAFIIITVLVLNVFVSFKFPGNKKVQTLEEHYDEIDEDEEYEDDENEDVEEYEEDVEYEEEDVEEEIDETEEK